MARRTHCGVKQKLAVGAPQCVGFEAAAGRSRTRVVQALAEGYLNHQGGVVENRVLAGELEGLGGQEALVLVLADYYKLALAHWGHRDYRRREGLLAYHVALVHVLVLVGGNREQGGGGVHVGVGHAVHREGVFSALTQAGVHQINVDPVCPAQAAVRRRVGRSECGGRSCAYIEVGGQRAVEYAPGDRTAEGRRR